MNKAALFFASIIISTSGCSFVEPKPESNSVKTLATDEISNCQSLGTVTTTVATQVLRVYRDEETVMSELEILAKNQAVITGGNVIVPITDIEDGSRTFRVYQCAAM